MVKGHVSPTELRRAGETATIRYFDTDDPDALILLTHQGMTRSGHPVVSWAAALHEVRYRGSLRSLPEGEVVVITDDVIDEITQSIAVIKTTNENDAKYKAAKERRKQIKADNALIMRRQADAELRHRYPASGTW